MRLKKRLLYLVFGVLGLFLFFYIQNNWIVTTELSISSNHLPASFDDYKIVHISDLHNKSFGKDQKALVSKVRESKPNIVVVTGDLVDARRYDEEPSLVLMQELIKIAPVYYVTGNHEWRSGNFATLEDNLQTIGITIMRNASDTIEIGNDIIQITGIDDPAHTYGTGTKQEKLEESILTATSTLEDGHFNILLAHRPEMLELYSQYDFDVVFSGHAHGGQMRIPFVGGLVAPDQGFFPKYTAGKHTVDQTSMIISRGLGNSIIPIRIFNRPELVVVTLQASND